MNSGSSHTHGQGGQRPINSPLDVINALRSEVPDAQLLAIKRFRTLLDQNDVTTAFVLESNLIPQFLKLLKSNDYLPQLEAIRALGDLAMKSPKYVERMVEGNIVHEAIRLLSSPFASTQAAMLRVLRNIARDGREILDRLFGAEIVPALAKLLSNTSDLGVLQNAALLFHILSREDPSTRVGFIISPATPALVGLLKYSDPVILMNACSALANFLTNQEHNGQDILDWGLCPRIVDLMQHGSSDVQAAALHLAGNLATADEVIEKLISCGILQRLISLAPSQEYNIRRDVWWVIFNMSTGEVHHLQAMVDAGIIPRLASALINDILSVRNDACMAISQFTSSPESVWLIPDHEARECIVSLCHILSAENNELVDLAVDALRNFAVAGAPAEGVPSGSLTVNKYISYIKSAGGLAKIHRLRYHSSPNIRTKVGFLMNEFFERKGRRGKSRKT